MKRQPTDRKKIFIDDVTDKGLVSNIYKQLMKLNIIKINNPIKKMGRRPKQTFLQRKHTDGQEAHKKTRTIPDYERNASQNYNETSPHTSQDGFEQNGASLKN